MSAAAKRAKREGRPPRFSTYVDVDVDIDPEDLEAAGWVYVGKGDDKEPDAATTVEKVLSVVQTWHEDTHEGPWRWCSHKPCDDLRGRE